MPCLCIAGVLHHPCDHGEVTECGHEDDCPTDPCASEIVAPAIGQASKNIQQIVKGLAVGPGAVSTGRLKPVGISAFFASVEERAGLRRVPIPLSDIPLLI